MLKKYIIFDLRSNKYVVDYEKNGLKQNENANQAKLFNENEACDLVEVLKSEYNSEFVIFELQKNIIEEK